jgi:predicted acyltransferase
MSRDPTRDIIRGLTSLEMTFVNISKLGWTLHSPFIGQITYADTIFPCFAFLAGMSPTSARRNAGLIMLGLGLNTVSAFNSGAPVVRIPGVLQRLGLAGLIANESFFAPLRSFFSIPLVALWYAITLLGASTTNLDNPLAHPDYPAANVLGTAQSIIDRALFGQRLYKPSYDPEGLLGSLTTAVSMVIGRSFEEGTLTMSQKAIAAISMIMVGESMHYLLPRFASISKSLWTPSFVLVTAGTSILKYIGLQMTVPFLPTGIQDLLRAVGTRSLEVYIISTIITGLLRREGIVARSMRMLESSAGSTSADLIKSLGLTAIVVVCSKVLVTFKLRLHW